MEVLVFNSIAEAKNWAVEPGKLYFIKDEKLNLSRLTRTWEKSKASSLPKEIRENPDYQNGILVKATDDKVKFYYLGGGRSHSTEVPYSTTMQSIFG